MNDRVGVNLESRREIRKRALSDIEELLMKRDLCFAWQADDRLRGLLDRQKEIDGIAERIDRLVEDVASLGSI